MGDVTLGLFSVLPLIIGVGGTIFVVAAIVMAVRALTGIDRSLRALVEQGVARGNGPFTTPPQ